MLLLASACSQLTLPVFMVRCVCVKVAEKMGAELHRKMLESLMEGLDDADDEEEEDVDL